MSRPIIEVENLSKRYKLGQFNARTLREEAEQFFARFRNKGVEKDGKSSSENCEIWALKDISFSLRSGEVMGIIGRNGAGKSTLLKILSRITEPTRGEARIRGRVASLLEVGTGFHPELSGRENIYLNGAILGMTRAEVKAKFEEIVTFAEVEKFLDTPVKRYSSGMYVRLAFAVAAHLEPEILIVDEVLAVGDVEFQKKCLGKMQSVSRVGGRTVIFVSHNMAAIAQLSSRALLIESGRIGMVGNAKAVIDRYLNPGPKAFGEQIWRDISSAPGNEHIRVHRIEIVCDDKRANSEIEMGSGFQVVIDYWNLVGNGKLVLNLYVYSVDGSPVFESLTATEPWCGPGQWSGGLVRSTCFIPPHLLNEGEFIVRINFLDARLDTRFDFTDAARVAIRNLGGHAVETYGRFVGHVHPKLVWRTEWLGNELPFSSTALEN